MLRRLTTLFDRNDHYGLANAESFTVFPAGTVEQVPQWVADLMKEDRARQEEVFLCFGLNDF